MLVRLAECASSRNAAQREIVNARTALNQAVPLAAAGAAPRFVADDFDRDVWCVLGLPFDRVSVAQASDIVIDSARAGRRLSFITPNAHWLARSAKDPEARRQAVDSDLSLADGAAIVALARLLGVPLPGRCAGSDLFDALRARPAVARRRLKVFFFGGREGAARGAHHALGAAGPSGVESAGWLDPGSGDVESMSGPAMIGQINESGADFVLVALGAAKGQAWIERNQKRLMAPIVAHLGAVVDFTAGSIRRAPKFFRRLGLEWAWRIYAEPALWRRYSADAWTLASIFLRQLAPQWRLGRETNKNASAPAAVLSAAADHVCVKLTGAHFHSGLDPARAAFRAAAAAGVPVRIDLTGCSGIDRAFLGLCLMLEKRLNPNGLTIEAVCADQRMARLLVLNGFPASIAVSARPETETSRSAA